MKFILISGKAEAGKDATANLLKETLEESGYRVMIDHYGDMVKYVSAKYFGWDGKKDEKGRAILQNVGTDIFRKESPSFWVGFIESLYSVIYKNYDYVLIPDTRFPNEINYLRSNGWDCITVRVERTEHKSILTSEQLAHPSETALDDFGFDYTIKSKSGLDNLKVEVEKLHKFITNKRG